MKKKSLLRCALLPLIAFGMPHLHAAVFNIPDGDVVSLKNAIITANGNGQPDIINLATNGTYTLTSVDNSDDGPNGLPSISNDAAGLDLTINGNGATIRRSGNPGIPEFRILRIAPGATVGCDSLTTANGVLITGSFPANRGGGILVALSTLTLTNCTVRNHAAVEGGGIWNAQGMLVLNGSTISINAAMRGGGIYNLEGSLSGSGSTFSDNSADGTTNAPGVGGAIFSASSSLAASVALSNCLFVANRIAGGGQGQGGAIYNQKQSAAATLALTNCTFDTNFGDEAFGGAISNSNSGAVNLIGCTLQKNYSRFGGAIYNGQGPLQVRGCTFLENTATMSPVTGQGGFGGAFYHVAGTLTLLDTNLRKNEAANSGGAIYNRDTVTASNCEFTANASVASGGAMVNFGPATLADCRLTGNVSDEAGAIFTSLTLTLQRCRLSTNTARFGGGGAILNEGTLTVESSTLDGNNANGLNGQGGAIATFLSSAPIETTLRASTLNSNSAKAGGAIKNIGKLTILNSTLSSNIASSLGGAVYNNSGNATLHNATLCANSAPTGGGIYSFKSTADPVVLLHNTVLRTGASGANLVNVSGTISSSGHNLSNDSAGGDATAAPGGFLSGPNDIRNSDPNLGPLQNNGGPTQTHAPVFPSPAIDSGDDSVVDLPLALTSDQRGPTFPRWLGAHVDRGAVETGASFIVTTVDDHDDGACTAADCTLREAIAAVNAVWTGNISFAPSVTGIVQLGGPLPVVRANLSLQGPGANLLTVRRNSAGDYRIFTISNATIDGPSVSLKGLTIANGRAPAGSFPGNSGGGILNDRGNLSLDGCAVIGNNSASDSGYGGGICSREGSLTVRQSTIAGNASSSGGGVANMVTTFGRYPVTLQRSTISGNTAAGGDGGGVYSRATNSGSLIEVLMDNCTLSGNSATPNGFVGGAGGAIFNQGSFSGEARLTLEDCTIANNSAISTAAIYNSNFGATASLTLRNTILKSSGGSNLINSSGAINSLGHNLCDDFAGDAGNTGTGPGGYLNAAGDIRNTDPLLGPLQDNGGPTQTHALLSGSPAINAGENTGFNQNDGRGFLRRGLNDLGAFEFNGVQLRITNIARAGNDLVISFDAAANLAFALTSKNSLSDATWLDIPNVNLITPTSDGIAQFTDPGAALLGRAFYRVELLVQ